MLLEGIGIINLWTFIAGLIVIIIAPGPNSLYVLKTAATRGVASGYQAALGVFTGDALLIFLSYLGVASLIRASPVLFTAVRMLGALYLLYLGVKIIYANFSRKQAAAALPAAATRENVLKKSLLLSLTNPKAILFYVSFFVQFIDFSYAHTALSYLVLAAILEFFSFIYLSLLIFGGVMMATFFRQRKTLAKLGNGLIGLLFLGFATRLATLSA